MMLIGTFFADAAPKDQLDDIDFFRFPIIDPKMPLVEEGPTDGYFASAHTHHQAEVKELMAYMATVEAQEIYLKGSSGTSIPTNPAAKDSGTPLVKKGRAMIESAADVTQFFNRDSSDALQPTADTALTKFLAKPEPDQLDPHHLAARRAEDLEPVTCRCLPRTAAGRGAADGRGGRGAGESTRVPPVVLAFVLIPLLAEGFWVFWPALQGFYLSLTKWDGVSPPQFIGLGNYREMIHDTVFHTAMLDTVLWLALFGGLSAILGLGAALLLQQERRGVGFYRAALFLPVVFSLDRHRAGVAGDVPAGRPGRQDHVAASASAASPIPGSPTRTPRCTP